MKLRAGKSNAELFVLLEEKLGAATALADQVTIWCCMPDTVRLYKPSALAYCFLVRLAFPSFSLPTDVLTRENQ